ncbi:MAG TPA: tRNA pseudouridine(55) synthase TruB [Burkholderiales bacterium]|nr:tRNA pseudouridine(55) synthase TruB [Burkholderiales bacterium]
MNQAQRRVRRHIDGVLLLDKPLGLSSNTALQRVKRLFNAEKAGHSGTLDPLATGLLPILLGEATKFGAFLLDSDKTYLAEVHFGIRTDTGDAEGEVISEVEASFRAEQLAVAMHAFRGPIRQVPPMYSALKRDGKALYEYARAGETVERLPRDVTIHAFDLIRFEAPLAEFRVRCSKGTYIRTLAEDLGIALGCGAHLKALRREAAGRFELKRAVTLATLEVSGESERDAHLLSLEALLDDLPALNLDSEQTRRFCQGQVLQGPWPQGERVRIIGDGGRFLGVGKVDVAARLHPSRLLRI